MQRFASSRLQRTWSNNSIKSDGGPQRLLSPAISVTQFYNEGNGSTAQVGKVLESSPLRLASYGPMSETPSVTSDMNTAPNDNDSILSADSVPEGNINQHDNHNSHQYLQEPSYVPQRASSVPLVNSYNNGDAEDYEATLNTLTSYIASPSQINRDDAAKAYAHAIDFLQNFYKQANLYDNAILRITGPPPRRSGRSGSTTPFRKRYKADADDEEVTVKLHSSSEQPIARGRPKKIQVTSTSKSQVITPPRAITRSVAATNDDTPPSSSNPKTPHSKGSASKPNGRGRRGRPPRTS